MERDVFIRHWNSFCCLTEDFEKTERFVYHGVIEKKTDELVGLVHGDVYSDAFRGILLTACSEFETMCRYLCKENGGLVKDIRDISKCILNYYPKITETRVYSKYSILEPLKEWKINHIDDNNIKVEGLVWWKAYDSIKHDEEGSFKKATLDNAYVALASLYIICLYVLKVSSGNLQTAIEFPPKYFRCEYTANYIITPEGELPDFGNMTTNEIVKEKWSK